MPHIRWLILLLLLLVGCTVPGLECTDPLGCVVVGPNDPVVLATLLDTTGPAAELSAEVARGISLALAERDSTILEHSVSLLSFDAGCRAAKGESASQEIATVEEVIAVLGTVCAESAEAALPAIAEAGGVLVSPANTDPALTHTAVSPAPAYFRTIPDYTRQAELMAHFADEVLEAQTAVILYDNSPYSEVLRTTFRDAFLQTGGAVSLQTRLDVPVQLDDVMQLTSLSAPDVLYLPLFETDATAILALIQENEALAETQVLGSDSLLLPSFPQGAGAAVDGMLVSGLAVNGNAYQDFLNRWQQEYGSLPQTPYAAFAYDAADLLLTAVADSAQVSSNGALLIGRQALRESLLKTTGFPALTGLLTCTQNGDCGSDNSLVIFRLADTEQPGTTWPPPVIWPQEN